MARAKSATFSPDKTPYAIAQELGRPPKTVVREIRGRAVESDKGAVGRVNNRCAHRYEYTRRDVVLKPSLLGIEQKVRPGLATAGPVSQGRERRRMRVPAGVPGDMGIDSFRNNKISNASLNSGVIR